MAISFGKPLPSNGNCLDPSHCCHHLPVILPLAVRCRQNINNVVLAIGPQNLRQQSKFADFRPVATAKALHLPSAADSPEEGVEPDISGMREPFSSLDQDKFDPKVGTLDINLPRRSLQVLFTCDACGWRSKRLINRHAYERGTVFVQCAGCEAYHKLADNLGLVIEYDLRDDPDHYLEDTLEE